MRKITEHQTNECNQGITIEADEPDPKYGNASHHYCCTYSSLDGEHVAVISMQHGPIGEVGVNGLTNEVLLAIVVDRLRGFQSGEFICRENAIALTKLEEARMWLELRTKKRQARGVEGTNVV